MKRGIIIIILLLLAVLLLLYPLLSGYYLSWQQSAVIGGYNDEIAAMSKERRDEEWAKAQRYNDWLNAMLLGKADAGAPSAVPEYLTLLNFNGSMGYLEIPKIKVNLPIYHGMEEATLKKARGMWKAAACPLAALATMR